MRYKDTLENKLTNENLREAWQGLNSMLGQKAKIANLDCSDPASLADELNTHFTCFNNTSIKPTWNTDTYSSSADPIIINENLVTSILR